MCDFIAQLVEHRNGIAEAKGFSGFFFRSSDMNYYSGPAGGPSHKMQPFSSPKGGSWSQAFHAWTVETGDKTSLFIVFCGEFFGNNRALYFDVTYKDVDRFRKGSVHEL